MARRTTQIGSVNVLERSLVAVSIVLVIVGMIAVGSASGPQSVANGSSIWSFMMRDVLYVLVGLGGFMLACRMPTRTLARLATPAIVVSLGLLGVVELMGTSTMGGQRWLSFSSFSFQPSELFKLTSCLYLAVVIARVERTSRHWVDILKWSAPVALGAGLIFLEPDMGTASVVLLVSFGMLILAGLPRTSIRFLSLLGLGALGVFAIGAPYRRQRLLSFLHPGADPNGAGYQVLQAKIGLGAGKWTGLGFGNSREKWGLLPNAHTDFIFAIIGEEFGLIGSVLVLGLFFWLITLGIQTARRAPDRESQLLASGITLWLALETIINVASVVGWWPVTGIPLPFLSYGGTSLIINLLALGLLVNVARRATTAPRSASATATAARAPLRPRYAPATSTAQRRGASAHTPLVRERRRKS